MAQFCLAKRKKNKGSATVRKVQQDKEYPVADPAGYGGSPKHSSADDPINKTREVPPVKQSEEQMVDERVLDRGDHHEILQAQSHPPSIYLACLQAPCTCVGSKRCAM